MQLLAPDILEEARRLSVAVCATGLAIGLLLWLLGWWGHRFWIVLLATVTAGVIGLRASPDGVQPLVTGLLLAVAAGALALALVRVVAFVAGGLAAWLAVHALTSAWDEPLIPFLAGGLAGLLLFRIWTMALTSLAGTLLIGYSGLCLADRLGQLDAVTWTEQRTVLLNWLCGGVALLGLAIQFLLERRRLRRQFEREEQVQEIPFPVRPRRWWEWGQPQRYRRAG